MSAFADTVVPGMELVEDREARYTAMSFRAFLMRLGRHGVPRNLWYISRQVRVYARMRIPRFVGGRLYTTVDFANIRVVPDEQGQGLFTSLLGIAWSNADRLGIDCLYVESVSSQRFARGLEKRGFTRTPESDPVFYSNYYLPLKD